MSHWRRSCGNETAGSRQLARYAKFALVVMCAFALGVGRGASAQQPAPAAKQPPPPVNVNLTTRDGISVGATYYGSLLGKEAVPVIMLHQFKGSRADFKDLAPALQAKGCAVLVPDLRGHGQSTRQNIPGGGEHEISAALLRQQDFPAMVDQDLEACKTFLMEKNNAGELNINKLCVIGAEMGAVLAVNWAAYDWHWPKLATGKQGQDVRAVVLISPTWAFKGINVSGVVNNRDIANQWSWMVIAGDQDANEMRETKRLTQQLDLFMPTPSDPTQAAEKQAVFFVPMATSLQGAKLLAAKKGDIAAEIIKFIDRRLVKQGFPWADRRGPL